MQPLFGMSATASFVLLYGMTAAMCVQSCLVTQLRYAGQVQLIGKLD